MTITPSANINCPACGKPVERSTLRCPFCGENVDWVFEEQRLVREYLLYASVALVGGALLSMAFLIPFGFLAMFPALIVPLWVALVAIGAAVWLMAGGFNDGSTAVGRVRRREEPMANHKRKDSRWR